MIDSRPIGILGGSFDPVHNGHLRVAIEACEALDLAEVRLIPLAAPNHRAAPIAASATRLAMLRAAACPPLVVDTCELERGGTSYTVDTLRELRQRWPARPLCLLLGRDAYQSLPSWHRPREIFELAHVVVAARPQGTTTQAAELDELTANKHALDVSHLHQAPAGRVYFLDLPWLSIASSDLRARRAAGRDIRHLVPDGVLAIIERERLYAT
jgi:nicotinate-nucleotide adenylyltransferase